MGLLKLFLSLLIILQALSTTHISTLQVADAANSKLFREYIGAEFKNVKFDEVPINPDVEFHFILSFAIDYDTSSSFPSPSPANGMFNVFWDSFNLSPSQVSYIKNQHSNVKVALSLGGDTVGKDPAFFEPFSAESWLANAVSSLTRIIKEYNLDETLKKNKVISFASIAPYDDNEVQSYYLALWRGYGHLIDYVNFQFYGYDKGTTVSQFLNYFKTQSSKYNGGKILTSLESDGNRGLLPENGFFTACNELKSQQQLHGIFVWSADDSKANGFLYERQSQDLLASSN